MCDGKKSLQRIEAKRREQGKQRIHKEPRTASWKDFTKGNSEKMSIKDQETAQTFLIKAPV